MNKFFDNLPKLTEDEKEKVETLSTKTTVIDNFTVKRCPLMDNFENMDPSLWNILNGSPITNTNAKNIDAEIHAYGKESMCLLSQSTAKPSSSGPKMTMPYIHGISQPVTMNYVPHTKTGDMAKNAKNDTDESDDDESGSLVSPMKLDMSTKMYVGALSIVGLFVLFRVVKKTL
jgi:hypothetical protein